MCRLLGIAGQPPLPVKAAVEAFLPLADKGAVLPGCAAGHEDGWGLSGFSQGRAVYYDRQVKPPLSSAQTVAPLIERALVGKSPVLIGHLRKLSSAPADLANTHPFHYRDWIFAHNGTIFNADRLDIGDYATQGATDSERFMVWLVDQLRIADDPTEALAALLKDLRSTLEFSALVFLLSDGKALWAYREVGTARLEPKVTVADRHRYYTLHMARVGEADVLCSEPLKAVTRTWTALEDRTLASFTPGFTTPVLRSL